MATGKPAAGTSVIAINLDGYVIGSYVEFGAVINNNGGEVPVRVTGLLAGIDHTLGSVHLHVAAGPDCNGFETFRVDPGTIIDVGDREEGKR